MIIYSEYEKFIRGQEDIVELNIIQLINDTLKYLKKEVIYSDVEKRFYIYDDKHWQQSEISKIVSIYWTEYQNTIFPQLKNAKIKCAVQYKKALVDKSPQASELQRVLKRYDWFIHLKLKKVKEFLESLSMSCPRIPDLEYNKIPLQNGYIDMTDFTFHNTNPYIFNRYVLQFNYKETTEQPKMFFNFLEQILPDKDSRDFLLNWLAYLLIDGNYRQKALFLYGGGNNGKGVLSRLIYELVGSDNCTSLTVSQLIADKNYYLSQLNNTLLNISPDSSDRDKIDIGTFKTLTGNDKIQVRDIYSTPFTMIYTGKLIYSINKVPYFSDKDYAVMRRVEILDFPVTIKQSDRIPHLEQKILDQEGDLIFSFLLARLKELKEIKYDFEAPQSVLDFTSSIMDQQDNLSIFLAEYITTVENDVVMWKIGLADFYKEYKEYAIEAGFNLLNRTNFKDNVMNWCNRRKDIEVEYGSNGKNYVFKFSKQLNTSSLEINENNILCDENGKEIF